MAEWPSALAFRDSRKQVWVSSPRSFFRSVSAGIGSQKGVLRFLGEEAALAVKDADPRISN